MMSNDESQFEVALKWRELFLERGWCVAGNSRTEVRLTGFNPSEKYSSLAL